jgi:transcriptional regulator with XRE-family HTH domain
MNALQRLIKSRMAELDLTFPEVERRGGPPQNTVWALVQKKVHKQPPRRATLEKLAKGLDLPLDVVRAAAAEAAGYRLEEVTTTLEAAEDVRIVAQAMGQLDAQDRAKLRMLAQAFLDGVQQDKQAGTR